MRDPAEATLIDHVARRRVPYDPLVRLALFGGLLFISPGCVFPVPNVRVEGYGVQSHVVDADSGRPVAMAGSPGRPSHGMQEVVPLIRRQRRRVVHGRYRRRPGRRPAMVTRGARARGGLARGRGASDGGP